MLSLKAGSRYWHNHEYRKAGIVFALENSPLFLCHSKKGERGLV